MNGFEQEQMRDFADFIRTMDETAGPSTDRMLTAHTASVSARDWDALSGGEAPAGDAKNSAS